MVPYGATPVDPSGPNQPGWINRDDPQILKEQYTQGPKHGTSMNVNISSSELNEVPVEQLAGNIGFQQATAEHPLLPPMQLLRAPMAERMAQEAVREKVYEELIQKLPARLQKKLKRQKKQALEDRQPHFAAFDESLQFMAATIALVTTLKDPERRKEGLPSDEELFEQWIDAMQSQGNAYLSSAKEMIRTFDAGHPERDLLSQMVEELSGSFAQLHEYHRKNLNAEVHE